jgi:hypothetical protein
MTTQGRAAEATELNQESDPDAAILTSSAIIPPKTNRELNIAGFFGDRAARLNPLDVLLAENRGDNDFYRSRANPARVCQRWQK